MSDLSEREKFVAHTCANCAFCVKAIYSVPLSKERVSFDFLHFCVVDGLRVPHIKIIENEVSELLKDDTGGTPSDELLEILQLDKSEPDITQSPRYVYPTDCCQFYEQGDFFKNNKKLPVRCVEERLNTLEKQCEELEWKIRGASYAGINMWDCVKDRLKAIWKFLGAPVDSEDHEEYFKWIEENTKAKKKEE